MHGRQLLLRCALAEGADHAIDIPCLRAMVSINMRRERARRASAVRSSGSKKLLEYRGENLTGESPRGDIWLFYLPGSSIVICDRENQELALRDAPDVSLPAGCCQGTRQARLAQPCKRCGRLKTNYERKQSGMKARRFVSSVLFLLVLIISSEEICGSMRKSEVMQASHCLREGASY